MVSVVADDSKACGEPCVGSRVEDVARLILRAHASGHERADRLARVLRSTTLPPELQAAATKRLGIVAITVAAALVCISLVNALSGGVSIEAERLVSLYGTTSIRLVPPITAAATIAFSIVVYWLSRRPRVAPGTMLSLGNLYQIVVSLDLALLTNLSSWRGVEVLFMWSGTAIWIIIFAVLVPSTPRRVLAVSLLAALMDPLGLGITVALGAPPPSARIIAMLVAPTFVAVGLAVACSITIHRLGVTLERARRMGSYELVELLGAGGMGEVWRAQHRSLARPAAIKLIRGESLAAGTVDAQRTIVARFEREAQATAALESAHTVTLFDYGVSEDGTFYYVMELLRGLDLEQIVARYGPQPPERVIHLLIQACRSLEEAHHRGLIHRDIKPANIFASAKGLDVDFVKVLDFGLVKRDQSQALSHASDARLTVEGAVTGTPDYIAPEMVVGDAVDARTDLYGLGCVAYFALCGHTVFDRDKPIRVLMAHISDDPPPLAERAKGQAPPALCALVHQCLEKDPVDRPASAREVRERLEAIELEHPWTQARARAWWAEHAPGLEPARVAALLSGDADTLPGSVSDSTLAELRASSSAQPR
jgi:serine/threonine-protein kinase